MEVGQKLWYVPWQNRHSGPYWVEVEKIGRKWATLTHNHGRIDIHSMKKDGGQYTSPGQCYYSIELYQEHLDGVQAWGELSNLINKLPNPPTHLNLNQIKHLVALVKSPGGI